MHAHHVVSRPSLARGGEATREHRAPGLPDDPTKAEGGFASLSGGACQCCCGTCGRPKGSQAF